MRKGVKKTDFSEKYIRWFSQLNNKDINIAGGKGASLSEMYKNKFPVPLGFIITAQAFDFVITKAKLKEKISEILNSVDIEDTEALQKTSEEIREMIESKELPKELEKEIIESYHILSSDEIDEGDISKDALNILKNAQEPIFVSVRSSATTEDLADASFAGQQDSFLNIKGSDDLIEHVKKCFSSLYTARAIYYRNKKGFKEGESLLAVVIQKMVDSEQSGVVFSRDPINLNEDIVIEAVFGLGEGIVSGKIHPDHYIISRDLKIKNIKVTNKKIAVVKTASGKSKEVGLSPAKSKSQVLSKAQILELTDYAIKLEKHYKKPQDIEFAVEGGEIFIVQSRPITTLKAREQIEDLEGKLLLEGLAASPGVGVGMVRIIKTMSDLPKIKKGDVLVTKMTNPDMVVSMQKSVAIVTDEGGMTSHASIVSREMGIPAIVGTKNATTILKDGMKITVDGANGKVYEGEVAKTQTAEIKPAVKVHKPKLKLIVDLPEFAERAAKSEVDSVGLVRMEGMITEAGKHPLFYEKENKLHEYTEVLTNGIEKLAKPFKSVWIRASDVRTDEFALLKGAPEKEINPMLGLHGIRFSLKHPEILEAELLAIKKAAVKYHDKKFGIMFPQIISVDEVKKAKEYFDKIKTHNMEFGVMIETPASVQIIEDICPLVDFISLGTNDLTQFTLAVDRGEDEVQHLYDEIHPAIFSQIEKVIDACKRTNTESSICGQAGSRKEMVEFLIKKGIDSISVNADAAFDISNLIKELEGAGISMQEEKEVIEEPVVIEKEELISEDGKLPDEQWKKMTRKEKRRFLRKMRKQKKRQKSKLPGLPKDTELLDAQEIKEQYEDRLLDEQSIQIPAEVEEAEKQVDEMQETVGQIKPFGSLERIEDKVEDIKQDVEETRLEQIQENKVIEKSIEVETPRKEVQEELEEEPVTSQESREEPVTSQEPSEEDEKPVTFQKSRDEKIAKATDSLSEEPIIDTKEKQDEKPIIDTEKKQDEKPIIDTEKKSEETEEGITSEPANPESVGVYNPDEEPDNTPKKIEYNFDEDEDVFSDVF